MAMRKPRLVTEQAKDAKVYTFGYGNRKSLEDLLAFCKEKGITLLVDVRRSPRGWSTIWSKVYLEKKLIDFGVKYLSLTALGNTTGTQQWIPEDLKEAGEALKYLESLIDNETFVLMCSEKDPLKCHRTEVAETLSKSLNCQVEHLV